MDIETHYINQIEVVINIFTVINGKIKVLLFKRNEDPYKGYWMLPSNLLMTSETIEECAKETVFEFAGLEDIYLKQCNVFSKTDRLPNYRIVANSVICLVDIDEVNKIKENINIESSWFDIDQTPKMVYDHGEILENSIEFLKNTLSHSYDMMKIFYKKDFTLPELQTTYEQILNKKLDRRNFRKKIINFVEDTNDKKTKTNGRPAKLYYFKDNIEGNLF